LISHAPAPIVTGGVNKGVNDEHRPSKEVFWSSGSILWTII